jgi:CheY-like chemotaxis protein/HPt (histidine-containing phosphotransfer) domain-containing protein
MKPMAPARVLLVEDDPVSRVFLAAAAAPVARVTALAGTAAALRCHATAPPFDLWLLDARLPDGDGPSLLAALRVDAPYTPALAHTADPDPGVARALLEAGFLEVLVKPFAAATLRAALQRALRGELAVAEAPPPDWDDAAALVALRGEHAHVAMLRGMFVAELPRQRDALLHAALRGDADACAAILHRLRAGCGLVGATRLDAAVRALQAQPLSRSAREGFEVAVAAALRMQDAAEV